MVRGEIFLLREALDGLRGLVFGDLTAALVQAGDEAVLVADGKVHVHEVDVDLDGSDGVVRLLLRGGVAHRRRAVGGGGLLAAQRRGGAEQDSEDSEHPGQGRGNAGKRADRDSGTHT